MSAKTTKDFYAKGLQLAETGQHVESLEYLNMHLAENPGDAEALSDVGAVLYCLGQNSAAIDHFKQSIAADSKYGQAYWNLFEAYINNGSPDKAAGLFNDMTRLEILNPDAVNRTANEFLQKNQIGPAIEMMLISIKMSNKQEILQPMIDVVKGKRPKIAFFGLSANTEYYKYISERFTVESFVGKENVELADLVNWCDIAWFEGINEELERVTALPSACKIIVRIVTNDSNCRSTGNIDMSKIDKLIISEQGISDNPVLKQLQQQGTLIVFREKPDNKQLCEVLEQIENETQQ